LNQENNQPIQAIETFLTTTMGADTFAGRRGAILDLEKYFLSTEPTSHDLPQLKELRSFFKRDPGVIQAYLSVLTDAQQMIQTFGKLKTHDLRQIRLFFDHAEQSKMTYVNEVFDHRNWLIEDKERGRFYLPANGDFIYRDNDAGRFTPGASRILFKFLNIEIEQAKAAPGKGARLLDQHWPIDAVKTNVQQKRAEMKETPHLQAREKFLAWFGGEKLSHAQAILGLVFRTENIFPLESETISAQTGKTAFTFIAEKAMSDAINQCQYQAPEIAEPEVIEIAEPEIVQPEIIEPDMSEPEMAEPEIETPEIAEQEPPAVKSESYAATNLPVALEQTLEAELAQVVETQLAAAMQYEVSPPARTRVPVPVSAAESNVVLFDEAARHPRVTTEPEKAPVQSWQERRGPRPAEPYARAPLAYRIPRPTTATIPAHTMPRIYTPKGIMIYTPKIVRRVAVAAFVLAAGVVGWQSGALTKAYAAVSAVVTSDNKPQTVQREQPKPQHETKKIHLDRVPDPAEARAQALRRADPYAPKSVPTEKITPSAEVRRLFPHLR